MEALNSKQKIRNEKRKKKLAALVNIMKINDMERLREMAEKQEQAQEITKSVLEDEDGFIKVTHRKKGKICLRNNDESLSKKRKIVEDDALVNNDTTEEQYGQLKCLQWTDEQYKEIKREIEKRKRQLQSVTKLRLREFGQHALLSVAENDRTPVFLTDLQHLVMFSLFGKQSPCTPKRWCSIDKNSPLPHTVVMCIEGLSLYHYLSNESKFVKTKEIFDVILEVIMPSDKKEGEPMAMIEEFAQVLLTHVQANDLINKHGSLEAAVELNKDPTNMIKGIFSVDHLPVDAVNNDMHPDDKFPRTKLLLSALQMVEEGYPMPLKGELNKHFSSYVMTKDKYAPVTNRSPLFGIDCEMCRTSKGINELTRISIVNENFETVYETLVRPTNKIVDYLTQYSGITQEIMMKVTKTLNDVHKEVRALLPPDAILVGQSLNCDLNAMRMMHPYVIDTSVCFNISGKRSRKSKLQKLAMTFLKETIQEHDGGHDSVEDSVSSLKLVKLKLANSIEFGDEILSQKKRFHDIIRSANINSEANLLAYDSQRITRTALITVKPLSSTVRKLLKKSEKDHSLNRCITYELSSNKDAIRKCKEISAENSLTLCNLVVSSEQLHTSSIDITIENVNKWISKIWRNMEHNAMLLVLMGGSAGCSSAVAMIDIKNNVANVPADVPLIV